MKTADQITGPDGASATVPRDLTARVVSDPSLSVESRAVIDSLMTGRPVEPAIARRIHEKARTIRERILKEQGLVDIAVPGARDFRGELPSS
jgi:hypothetical protein